MTKRLLHILAPCILALALANVSAAVPENAVRHPDTSPGHEKTSRSGNAPTPRQQASGEEKADSSADTTPAPATAPPATTSTPIATPAEPANASAPLEENGLIVQILSQLDRWNDSFEQELRRIMRAFIGTPAMLQRFGASLADTSRQALLIKEILALAIAFAIGLMCEWMLRRALLRSRRALVDHAEQLEQHIQLYTSDTSRSDTPSDTRRSKAKGDADSGKTNDKEAETASGMHPAAEGVALVRSYRDGIDQVEAVDIDTATHADEALTGAKTQTDSEDSANTSQGKVPAATVRAASHKQWSTLRQLPFAIGVLLLDLLPLALFFFVTAVLTHWLGRNDASFRHMVYALTVAYVSMRVAMAVLRLFVAPSGCGVSLLRVRPDIENILYRWLRRIIVTIAFGIGLTEVAQVLGAEMEERLVLMKIVSLIVHLLAVILIFRIWRPVGMVIAAPPDADGPLAAARNWLAKSWAVFAAILVMGVWVVWALGVEDGFEKLLHFIGVTAGVIIIARILAILLLGALGRIFHMADGEAATSPATPSVRARADRYYPLLQRLVVGMITACAIVALLQAWGIDVIGWLTERPIGRMLLSALLTIAIAVIVGILVWEVINAAVERRLAAWRDQGDTVRAARLRTLMPILRTCLFIVITLVVGLTALNELGVNTTPLLASASIVGVALGFGSQKLVQDFITGIFLLMENAMQVGEWVTVAGVSGTVEDLSIRTVRLRAGDGSMHIVPFSSVSTVSNSNRGLGNAVMRVSVSYGTDIDLVTNELKQIGADLRTNASFKDNILGDLEIWGVDAVDGSTVTLAGQMRCTDKGRWGVQRELNRRILERFRQLGIQIADPRATVLLPREATPPVVSAVQQVTHRHNGNSDSSGKEKPEREK